jgi:hypothetical protein
MPLIYTKSLKEEADAKLTQEAGGTLLFLYPEGFFE